MSYPLCMPRSYIKLICTLSMILIGRTDVADIPTLAVRKCYIALTREIVETRQLRVRVK